MCLSNVCSQGVNEDISAVLNELWKLDANRLKPGKDYIISLQVKTLIGGISFPPQTKMATRTAILPCLKLEMDLLLNSLRLVKNNTKNDRLLCLLHTVVKG